MTDVPRLSGHARLAGRRLRNRYRLENLLGSGGMAHVWEATDEVLERRVAVKILHDHLQDDDLFVARFRAEGVAAARLAHRSIISIYDQISEPDLEAIVMELITGETMRDWLDRNSIPPLEDSIAVLSSVADALAAAHEMGIVHRDIKPSNILLSTDGRVIVADFGIAKLATDPSLTATGALLGTARYLSPEQVRGDHLDGRSDLYSVAVLLYECLCGRTPFDAGNDMATALARLQRDPAPPRSINNGIPPAVEAVVLRGLAVDVTDRFPDCGTFRVAMQSALRGVGADQPVLVTATPNPPTVEGAPSFTESERSWIVPTLVLLLIVVGLGVVGLLISSTDAGQDLLDSARDVVGVNPTATDARAQPTAQPVAATTGEAIPNELTVVQLATAASFDPEGTGNPPTEREDLVGAVFDADLATMWQTEGYIDRGFGNLKSGVGFAVALDATRRVDRVELTSPSVGWAMELYAGVDGSAVGIDGEPLASAESIDGDVVFSELDAEADWVLVWITDLGDSPSRVRVHIGEIVVFATT